MCRSATRRRGLPQGRSSAPGRTRAVSACSTRAIGPARSRQSAQLCAAAQGQPPSHRPAIGSERDASAERCRAVVLGGAEPSRVVESLRPRRARAVQAAQVPWAAASPMAQFHEPAGANERTARRSIVHGARTPPERGRCVAQGRSDGTTSPRARSRRPRARPAGMFEMGDKQCT